MATVPAGSFLFYISIFQAEKLFFVSLTTVIIKFPRIIFLAKLFKKLEDFF